MTVPSKTIVYRGGIVTFAIPAHWREEHEPEGGGTYYEDRPDSGTLRLNVISFDVPRDEAWEPAIARLFTTGSEPLQGDLWLQQQMLETEEVGTALHMYLWKIGVPVPPRSGRMVTFTYTILAGQEADPVIASELAVIEESIRNACYSREPGVSGSYPMR